MNIEIFQNNELGCEIRTVQEGNEILFAGKDVAMALGYKNETDALSRHCKGVVKRYPLQTSGGTQEIRVISQSDVMRLICSSKLPSAERFEKWVFEEVLPSVLSHGGYMVANQNESDSDLMARAFLVAQETIKRRDQKISTLETKVLEDAPKVLYADTVAGSKSSCLIGELAKLITQKGYKIGQNTLFSWMRDNGYLCVRGENYNMPMQRFVEQGFFEIKKGTRLSGDGASVVTRTVKVTGKGQIYFVNKFLGK